MSERFGSQVANRTLRTKPTHAITLATSQWDTISGFKSKANGQGGSFFTNRRFSKYRQSNVNLSLLNSLQKLGLSNGQNGRAISTATAQRSADPARLNRPAVYDENQLLHRLPIKPGVRAVTLVSRLFQREVRLGYQDPRGVSWQTRVRNNFTMTSQKMDRRLGFANLGFDRFRATLLRANANCYPRDKRDRPNRQTGWFPNRSPVLIYRMPFVILSLSDRVHEYLRERIISHEIPPGEAIRQDALAAELGVSKIPIREALSRLVESNMVQAHANRGFIAAPLSVDELEELFALRLLLEPPIAAKTAVSADQVQREQVKVARDELMRDTGRSDETMKLRRLIMLSLLHQPRHKTTMNILVQVFDRSERYHVRSIPSTGSDANNLKPLVSAWLKGDADRVTELYRARILKRMELARVSLPF